LLHATRPPYRWIVKAPYHNFHLADLATQYPNTRFVMTHRDPAVALPSTCSTVATAQQAALPDHALDPAAVGSFLLEHLVDGIGRAMSARQNIGEDRFLDVTQRELEGNPLGTVERIYDFLGLELNGDIRAAMSDWAEANRRGARGEHRYRAEDYGLTRDQIRRVFAGYIDRFQLGPESG
jgi:hypothetical protein